MAEQLLRNVAYKAWISDLVNAEYFKPEGEFAAGFVSVKFIKVSRVNLIGIIVDKYINDGGTYAYLIIDDGSAKIKIRGWNEHIFLFENLNVGDAALVIGKLKEQNEIYVTAEILKKLDPVWAKYRREELLKLYGEPKKIDVEVKHVVSDNPMAKGRQALINSIERIDSGDGAD